MKTNEKNARSEHAKNEKRDSHGRFESESKNEDQNKGHMGHNNRSSHSETAKNEKRDSHGRFESSDKK